MKGLSMYLYMFLITVTRVKCSQREKHDHHGNLLLLMPLYTGSHEWALDRIGLALFRQGWTVTKIRFLTTDHVETASDIETISLKLNQTFSQTRHATQDGRIIVDKYALWNSVRDIRDVDFSGYKALDAFCHTLLSDRELFSYLQSKRFTVAVVDAVSNECGMALIHALGIPAIGHWGGAMTGIESNIMGGFVSPATNPDLMSEVQDLRKFSARLKNSMVALGDYLITLYTAYRANNIIQVSSRSLM